MASIALVAASGIGSRFSQGLPKQYSGVDGKSILEICLEGISESDVFDHVVIAVEERFTQTAIGIVKNVSGLPPCQVVNGGQTRRETLAKMITGVSHMPNPQEHVLTLIDANRPLTSKRVYQETIRAAMDYGCACPVLPQADGLALLGESGFITSVPARESWFRIQTPESFKLSEYMQIPDYVKDDVSLLGIAEIFLADGRKVATVASDERGIKITHPFDWEVFLCLFRGKSPRN
jgi:2-C-methyl-D-erythritol 4-phosphate cytidylyltransferase